MIIQIDTYEPKIIEFVRTYLDYYHNDWKSVPIHRLASLDFRQKINEGKLDSTPLGIDIDYELSRFNKGDYELSKVNKQCYDFPGFDGEAILIFLRYLDKHNNYEKEAIIRRLYDELGPYGIGNMFKRKSHKKTKPI